MLFVYFSRREICSSPVPRTDHTPTVWFADNGERLGTYRGHNGAVWCCDVSRDSMRLITGSADQTVKLWNVQTGTQLFSFNFDCPAKSVDFSVADKLAVITIDPFMGLPSTIQKIFRRKQRKKDQDLESVLTIKGPQGPINRAVWGPLNKTIISAGEDAVIRVWDTETGQFLKESDKETGHQKTISSLSKSADGSHFLTGSLDKSAKNSDTCQNICDGACLLLVIVIKLCFHFLLEDTFYSCIASVFLTDLPKKKVVIGGGGVGAGQEAVHVTTTDHRAGKFEAKFFHKILQEEIGA
uniref:Serine-threonine kinase receptor-associated protein n=1 Tax=Musa acuminata subsp. malaccensis TaxID=214687 RepID=A0A804L6R1_MUSAM